MKRLNYIGIFVFLSLLLGCATIPTTQVWRPWTRTLESETPLLTNRTMSISVSGQTNPLLGNEDLTKDRIKENVINLLERRGFEITEEEPDYLMLLTYNTVRHDKMSSFSSFSSTSSSLAGTKSGLGVSLAQAIGFAATSQRVSTTQSTFESEMYNHTISAEIYNSDEQLLWKGESTWDTEYLDLTSNIIPALQIIFCYLPSDPTCIPEVEAVKATHTDNYFNLYCMNRRFSCPALPYRLFFREYNFSGITHAFKDRYALAAYVDLMQTAEYALPTGSKNWDNPLKSVLWSKVKLGGQYILEPKKEQINIIMNFTGHRGGYFIDKCDVVSDAEYSEFRIEMDRWQQTLEDYYDVYEK